jgi:hypothetical protein
VNRNGLCSRDVGTQDAEESNAGRKGPEPIRSWLPCTSCQVNGHGDSVEAQRTSGESSTSFTTAPTGRLRPPHHRMPGVLPAVDCAPWRDPGVRDVERLQAILRPFLGERSRGRAPGGDSHRASTTSRQVIDWCWGGLWAAPPRPVSALALDIHLDHMKAIGKSVGDGQENRFAASRAGVCLRCCAVPPRVVGGEA